MDRMMLLFEIIGTVAFSISGAFVAIRKGMDLLGVLVMGLVTAVGGGVIRDVVTGSVPPKAFTDPGYAGLAIVVAAIAFVIEWKIKKDKSTTSQTFEKILFLSDSVGLATFTVFGIRCVQEQLGNDNYALLIFVGVITGVGGGVLRDLFANTVPSIFRKHVYATASIVGACSFLLAEKFVGQNTAAVLSLIITVLIRVLAGHFQWNLPCIEWEKNKE